MDRADRCWRAIIDVVADVGPPHLHDVIVDTLDDASLLPGVLTLESAMAIDSNADLDAIASHAAGVQLIYEGLRLTRTLAHEEPWTTAETNGICDLEILAADILVARGFYVLARTDAADTAVTIVQNFGHDQTRRNDPGADSASLDANLEHDILELAIHTGAAAVGTTPTPALQSALRELTDIVTTEFPPAHECLPLLETLPAEPQTDDTLTDHATSASDP